MDWTRVNPGRACQDEAGDSNGGQRHSRTCCHALRRAMASGYAVECVGHVEARMETQLLGFGRATGDEYDGVSCDQKGRQKK